MIDPPPGYASWLFYVIARYETLASRDASGFCLLDAGKHAHEEVNELLNELSELRKSNKS